MIYLDNNATTQVVPRVLAKMKPFFEGQYGNAASNHNWGWKAKDAVLKARKQLASLLGVEVEEIYFTSGATESNHLVIQGVVMHCLLRGEINDCHIITSNIEHKCVLEACKRAQALGASLTILKANADGVITPDTLEEAIKSETRLVSLMYANNELGSINPIPELAKICRENSVLFHTDAAQAVGKIDLELDNVDYVSMSAHKFYGPKGVGALYCRTRDFERLEPLMPGGGQEKGLRSGTLNVPGIIGMGAAAEIAKNKSHRKEVDKLTDKLLSGIRKAWPKVRLNGSHAHRLPGNLNLTFIDSDPDDLEMALDDVAYSNSSACSAGDKKGSYVLEAIGLSEADRKRSLRLGVGLFNTEEEIDQVITAFTELNS